MPDEFGGEERGEGWLGEGREGGVWGCGGSWGEFGGDDGGDVGAGGGCGVRVDVCGVVWDLSRCLVGELRDLHGRESWDSEMRGIGVVLVVRGSAGAYMYVAAHDRN